MTTQCPWTRILTSEPRFDWDVSDRGRRRRRQGKLLFKKWICVFSTFIAIIPTHLYCREKSMRTLLELNSYEPYARAKLFFCLLNLLVFWSSCCRIAVLPIVYPPPTQEAYIGYPRLHFIVCTHWTNTGNVYGTKIFKPKIIGGYPTENFFRKIVNPREHSTVGRG